MYFVAFFRNVNLGHPKSPTRAQLEAAFAEAGAVFAQSFQTNGTLIFSSDNEQAGLDMIAQACDTLRGVCGLKEPAFICPLQALVELVDADPFARVAQEAVYMYCASFLAAEGLVKLKLPLQTPRGEVEVIQVTQAVLSISRKVTSSPGNPTSFLEKLLKLPVTTRNWNTILRLVKKYRPLLEIP